MAKLTVNDLDVRGKRLFVRVDYNVPMEEKDGRMVINDATRIKETLPTLDLLINNGARIILAAHLGRPKGQREPSMSLRPVAEKLADMINRPVAFVDDCIGEKVEKTVGALKDGDVLLLENVRYHNEEEANDAAFAEKLAKVADAIGLDMESAALAAEAQRAQVPFVIVRTASDLLDEDLPLDFNLFLRPTGWLKGVAAILGHPSSIMGLRRLHCQSRVAATTLTTFFQRYAAAISARDARGIVPADKGS